MKIFLSLCILPFTLSCVCVCLELSGYCLKGFFLVCQAFLVILLERPKFGWILVFLSLLTFAGSRRPKENTWNTTTLFLYPEAPNLSVFSSFFKVFLCSFYVYCTHLTIVLNGKNREKVSTPLARKESAMRIPIFKLADFKEFNINNTYFIFKRYVFRRMWMTCFFSRKFNRCISHPHPGDHRFGRMISANICCYLSICISLINPRKEFPQT